MVLVSWKIKLKNPSSLIKQQFHSWYYNYKYAYNKAIWYINESTCYYSKFDLRNFIIPSNVNSGKEWFLETPFDIRADAVFDAYSNLKSAITNLQEGNITHFRLGFKKKTSILRYTFGGISGANVLRSNNRIDDLRRINFFSTYTNNYQFHLSKPIPIDAIDQETNQLTNECKIHFNGIDFYLIICFEKQERFIPNRKSMVSVDPGIRKFATTWDPTDKSYMFGTGKWKQIKDLLKKKSYYQSNGNQRQMNNIEIRIANLINEMHHKTSTFLCKKYSTIIYPHFDAIGIVNRIQQNEKTKNYKYIKELKKSLLRLSFSKFEEILKTKGLIYNTEILIEGVTEAYSSRLCSSCKFVNLKDSKETKECKGCGKIIDRDINGAKNIYHINSYLKSQMRPL